MRNRWYDSGLGRFISRDPIGLGGENLYLYCRNNPAVLIDPYGTDPIDDLQYYLDSVSGEAGAALRRELSEVPIYKADKINGEAWKANVDAETLLVDGNPTILLNPKVPAADIPQIIAHELVHYLLLKYKKKKKKKKCSAQETIDEEKLAYWIQSWVDLIYPSSNKGTQFVNDDIRRVGSAGDPDHDNPEALRGALDRKLGQRADEFGLLRHEQRQRQLQGTNYRGLDIHEVSRSQITNMRRVSFL